MYDTTSNRINQVIAIGCKVLLVLALAFDDLSGYQTDQGTLECGWNRVCVTPGKNCIYYEDIVADEKPAETAGIVWLVCVITALVSMTLVFLLNFDKNSKCKEYFKMLLIYVSAVSCIIGNVTWIVNNDKRIDDGDHLVCMDTEESGVYYGVSSIFVWIVLVKNCFMSCVQGCSWKLWL